MMGFAGLYNVWTNPKTKDELYTYTIITTKPNSVVGKFHDREPAILHKNQEKEWLSPDLIETEQIMKFLKPYPADEMETWEVGNEAKNPKIDTPAIITPIK